LVLAANGGDGKAWRALVHRYTPLIESVARQYRLSQADAEDLHQTVWLRAFESLARLREILALPGWIKTTARNEAIRTVSRGRRVEPRDPTTLEADAPRRVDSAADQILMQLDYTRAITEALSGLSAKQRSLLHLLHAEPQPSYEMISGKLGLPMGSIGPTRARCLAKLRKSPAIQGLHVGELVN